MTKEEAERERAQLSSSSSSTLPPRPVASTSPPSVPPQTDAIDTDWGEPPPAREERVVRPVPLHSRTLIGMAAPPPPPAPPVDFTPLPPTPTPTRVSPSTPYLVAPAAPATLSEPARAAASSPAASSPAASSPAASRTATPKFQASSALRPHSSLAAGSSTTKGSGRTVLGLSAAALVMGALGYVTLHRPAREAAMPSAAAALPPVAPPAAPGASAQAAAGALAPSESATAAAGAALPAAATAPAAGAGEGVTTVTVNTVPPKGKFYHFGRQVGTAPFVVQLKPGERHAYEVGLPGHITRKVVLDGARTQLTIGLREDPKQ